MGHLLVIFSISFPSQVLTWVHAERAAPTHGPQTPSTRMLRAWRRTSTKLEARAALTSQPAERLPRCCHSLILFYIITFKKEQIYLNLIKKQWAVRTYFPQTKQNLSFRISHFSCAHNAQWRRTAIHIFSVLVKSMTPSSNSKPQIGFANGYVISIVPITLISEKTGKKIYTFTKTY